MDLEELKEIVPSDWLDQHRQEYIELAEKITKTIMMAEAANKGWRKPLTELSDFEAFVAAEARDRGLSEKEVRGFLMDAGKIKARNRIFQTYVIPLLPTDKDGNCTVPKKVILEYIRHSVEEN